MINPGPVRPVTDERSLSPDSDTPPPGDARAPMRGAAALPKVCPECGLRYEASVLFCAADGTSLRGESLIGQVVARRYRIDRELGRGGMGTVFLAQHVHMRRWCALKIINRSGVNDPDIVSRFQREAANASQIEHPNVATVYDFGEDSPEVLYLAMEFVDGEPLHAVLEREGAVSIARTVELIRQVSAGLAAAHERHIVHRDLKPDNIMVRKNRDGTETVKLVDFGIARVFEAGSQQVTRTGLVVGTPAYMSPEQLTASPMDVRSDIYSLALVTFRMLTGKLPFHGKSSHEEMVARLSRPPQTLGEARTDIVWPSGMQRVFDRALAADPGARYQTVAEFAADLVQAAVPVAGEGTPVTVTDDQPSVRQSHVRPAGALTRRLVAAAAVIVLLLGGVSVWRGWAGQGRQELASKDSPTRDTVERTAAVPDAALPGGVAAGQEGVRRDSGQAGKPTKMVPAQRPQANTPVVTALEPDTQPATTGGNRGMKTSGGEVPPGFAAAASLDTLYALTDPSTVNEANDRQALRMVAALLPRLTRRADSVSAIYYQALAHLHLDQTDEACRLLKSIQSDAGLSKLTRVVEMYLQNPQVGCR
jgi:eukaryotic-like serine/threonine-protein kinase